MMQHMVMKHGDQFSSYYDHMVYPTTLYGSICSGKKCAEMGTGQSCNEDSSKIFGKGSVSMDLLYSFDHFCWCQ